LIPEMPSKTMALNQIKFIRRDVIFNNNL